MLLRLRLELEPDTRSRVEALLPPGELQVQPIAEGIGPRQEPIDLVIAEVSASADVDRFATRVQSDPTAPMLALTRDLDPADQAALLGHGAYAVLPTSIADEELAASLAALIERRRSERVAELELVRAVEQVGPEVLVAASPSMANVLERVARVAAAPSPVLIQGETGVGKERIAGQIHQQSPRRGGPFIALNCAAIPDQLVESELFGHVRGAFTGATATRRGYFELAHQGTLFLDEIGDIPLEQQAKLLRVLQERRFRPVGGDREIEVDVRVVAATNRDLHAEVTAGRFREDLYYRLSVIELEVPPLRERPEDIEPLIDLQLARLRDTVGRRVEGIQDDARAALLRYAWPGNVRELMNVLERAVLLCLGSHITLEDLPRVITGGRRVPANGGSSSSPAPDLPAGGWLHLPWKSAREELLRHGERAYLEHLLRTTGGRVGLAARQAGIAERSLFEKMRRHGLRKEDFREGE